MDHTIARGFRSGTYQEVWALQGNKMVALVRNSRDHHRGADLKDALQRLLDAIPTTPAEGLQTAHVAILGKAVSEEAANAGTGWQLSLNTAKNRIAEQDPNGCLDLLLGLEAPSTFAQKKIGILGTTCAALAGDLQQAKQLRSQTPDLHLFPGPTSLNLAARLYNTGDIKGAAAILADLPKQRWEAARSLQAALELSIAIAQRKWHQVRQVSADPSIPMES